MHGWIVEDLEVPVSGRLTASQHVRQLARTLLSVQLFPNCSQTRPERQTGQPLVRANPLILLARLAGFEPTTPWFVGKMDVVFW